MAITARIASPPYADARAMRLAGIRKGVGTMIDLVAFGVVAIALGTPFLVPLLWGHVEWPSHPPTAELAEKPPGNQQ
jgi:hypothetical protein